MHTFRFRGGSFAGTRKYICGILNVTPDSFSDGGQFFAPKDAVRQAMQMQAEGADMLDIGAVSTRPGSIRVTEAEELARLMPVLAALRGRLTIPLSVDTFRPSVAAFALENGAAIINDVGGFSAGMAAVVRQYGAGWVAVHTVGMDAAAPGCYPQGVVQAVQAFFEMFAESAAEVGIPAENICYDSGFGFSKNTAENIELLRRFDSLDTAGCFLMAALSRKRFLGELTGIAEPSARLGSTLAADQYALTHGADIIRVHDVAAHRQALTLMERIL